MKRMKQWVALFMVAALVLGLAACGGKKENGGQASGQSAMEALPENATPAQKSVADFTDRVNGGETSPEALAQALSEAEYLGFSGAMMQVEPGWLNGFTEEIGGFTDGYMFGPVIGSMPYIGYVFAAENGKAADLEKALKAAADLRWNICTAAEDMQSAVIGDLVCFVMSPISMEEN